MKMGTAALFSSLLAIILLLSPSNAQDCSTYTFTGRTYAECNTLPVLNAFLHWNYYQTNNSVEIAYRHTGMTDSNWIVWALNPTRDRMLGSQCLVAFTNGTGVRGYTSPISETDYGTQLAEGPLSFRVPSISAELVNGQMTIYATIELPAGRTSFPQVWQHGNLAPNGAPSIHPTDGDHLSSYNTIDFLSGRTVDTGAASIASRDRKRNIHGVLNAVSWGVMMPIGAMLARYLKVFKVANPAWFYLHVTCQASAYIVGVAGWGTGLKLGSDSPGVKRTMHRNIGISLFVFGTLQVFALLLRPKPDHKYRIYWNVYHIGIGYSVIILSIINIFEGFDILSGQKYWKRAYIGILIVLGAVALFMEALTWFIVIKRKRAADSDKRPQTNNGVNGYGA